MATAATSEENRLFEPASGAGRSSSADADSEDALACLDTFSAFPALDGSGGFSGVIELTSPESLSSDDAGAVLERLAALASWTQAQQARVIHRMEELIAAEVEGSFKKPDDALAMSLTAAEAGAVLNIPHMSAMQLVDESDRLCTAHAATLAALSHGHISHRHARAMLDQLQGIPGAQSPGFEAELLSAARGRTCAQFMRTARRLREHRWPETMATRHRSALDRRGVSFDPVADGMGELTARIAAEKGQAIFTALTLAAQGERKAGDPRTLDQLRADIFTSLMLNSDRGPVGFADSPPESASAPSSAVGPELPATSLPAAGSLSGPEPRSGTECNSGSRSGFRFETEPKPGPGPARGTEPRCAPESKRDDSAGIKAEIMVLISADTLFGLDDNPAELNGAGPITAEAGRRLARQALHWTGLVQDSSTGEILAVGRRRKVPAGLKRWLQARDGTCRFPGCGVAPARAEVDHTIPWARGGLTEHGNLANLCPKHHRYKTLGFWRARQETPGLLKWISPLGRIYRTVPQLHYGPEISGGLSTEGSLPTADPDPPPF